MINPKVSVIIPVYKVENYIHRCMKSILAQSFSDFECILVDDCSPDGSGQICDDYEKQDSRIKVIHKSQNEGSSLARKTGLENSCGDYIQFMDSDDFIEPNMIEKMYSMAISGDYDLIYCNWYNYDMLNQILYEKAPVLSDDFIANVKSLNFKWGCVLWNKLVKREMYKEINFPKFSCCEDTYITTQLVFFCKKIGGVDAPLYHYTFNHTSIINNPKSKKKNDIEGRTNFISAIDFIMGKCGGSVDDPELSRRIKKIRDGDSTIIKIKKKIKKILKSVLPYAVVMNREMKKTRRKSQMIQDTKY